MKILTTISETESNDTIAALATANGRSAIAVVRISGSQTLHLLTQICRTNKGSVESLFTSKQRQLHRVDIVDPFNDGNPHIDDGLVVFFKGPGSYTGEDSAEISLHGSPLIVRRLLMLLVEKFRIRPALAGEFTRRAFQNGRIDLTKAESIQRIIDSKSEYELLGAQRLYSGELKKLVSRFRSSVINLKAETEAEVDFSDEDLTFESLDKRRNRVNQLLSQIQIILKRSGAAQRINQGFKVALVGATNAGKSSLLNRLLGWDRSIVSDIHGTTRDYVSEDVELGEFRVRFVDTAGLRSTQDVIEREGIRRSVEEMKRSQLILHIIDGSASTLTITDELKQELADPNESRKIIHILNKIDILNSNVKSSDYFNQLTLNQTQLNMIQISCKTGEGIDRLRQLILNHFESEPGGLDPFLLEERHRHHFTQVSEALNRLLQLWNENAPDEICAVEIDEALNQIGQITGEVTTEEVLGRIFSVFCVGK